MEKKISKQKILKEMKVKDKVIKIIDEFALSEEAFRFLDASHQRSKYQQKFDKAFYNKAMNYINKLGDLLVLTNAEKMMHLWAYRNSIKSHKTTLKKIYKQILKAIDKYENKYENKNL